MLRATSDTAVASRVRSVPENPARVASSRAACRAATMSGSAVIGDVDLVVAHRSPSEEGLTQAGAQLALQQVPGGIQLPLAPPLRAREREQHRSAPVRRRLRPLQGQQVLDPAAEHASA